MREMTPRHITKLLRTVIKRKPSRQSEGKHDNTFALGTMQGSRVWGNVFTIQGEKDCQPRTIQLANVFSKYKLK